MVIGVKILTLIFLVNKNSNGYFGVNREPVKTSSRGELGKYS